METSASLLLRVKNGEPQAWADFAALYEPFLTGQAKAQGLQAADAEDIAQDVLVDLHRSILANFEYDRQKGRFSSFLYAILRRRLIRFWHDRNSREISGGTSLQERIRQEPDSAPLAEQQFAEEHNRFLVERLMKRLEVDFSPETLLVFRRDWFDRIPAPDIAREFQIRESTVYQYRNRVLTRLRAVVVELFGGVEP